MSSRQDRRDDRGRDYDRRDRRDDRGRDDRGRDYDRRERDRGGESHDARQEAEERLQKSGLLCDDDDKGDKKGGRGGDRDRDRDRDRRDRCARCPRKLAEGAWHLAPILLSAFLDFSRLSFCTGTATAIGTATVARAAASGGACGMTRAVLPSKT